MTIPRLLEALGQAEKLEDLSLRYGVPHIPEHELSYFRGLYFGELSGALKSLEAEKSPRLLAWRGRVRRLMGDALGAARDLKEALDLNPRMSLSMAWLGELALGEPSSEESLSQAIGLEPGLACAYLYRGAGRWLAGKFHEAGGDFEAFARLRPNSSLGHLMLGLAQNKEGRRRPAVRSFARAAELSQGLAAAHILRARSQDSPGAFAASCEDAFDAEPDYAHLALFERGPREGWEAYLRKLVRFSLEEGRAKAPCARCVAADIRYSPFHYEAVAIAARAKRRRPDRAWAWALWGRALARSPRGSGLGLASLEALDAAVELAPGRGWPLAWRALSRLALGRPREALKDLDEALRLQPYYYRAYAWRGAVLRKLGRPRRALEDLDRAVSVDEDYPFTRHERSLARRDLGDYAGAAADLDQAFRQDHRYSWVHAVGREPSREELEAGIAELDTALKRCPRSASLRTWRGQALMQARDFPRAILDFSQALALDPLHGLAHAWQGRALCEAGDPGRAELYLRKAAELEPGLTVVRGWMARCLFAQGRGGEALRLLEGLLRQRPRLWWAHQERGRFLFELGRGRAALAAFEKAAGLEGRDAESYYLSARVRLELGRAREALSSVEKALAISPNHGRAVILRARINESLGRPELVIQDWRLALDKFDYLFNEEEKGRLKALLNR
ncbi:MAG: tetratricopeptide repeat protein [Elusimicrobia bacterium]|nr:tetratricopeptide repeat protein [Elusimicrobiota bacterium]